MSNDSDSTLKLTVASMIAALYVVLTLPMANFAFGIVQFRLAESLAILPAFSPAAIPGVFLGCLIANVLNPNNLGLVDIIAGSFATLGAALLTCFLARGYRQELIRKRDGKTQREEERLSGAAAWMSRLLILFPPVLVNALIVGAYLPFLLLDHLPTQFEVMTSIGMIFMSQLIVIYAIGLPLMLGLEKIPLPLKKLQ